MPPVRWKLLIFGTVLCFVSLSSWCMAYGQQVQETISMSSDGWRPIVGTGRHSSTVSVVTEAQPAPQPSPSPSPIRRNVSPSKPPQQMLVKQPTGPGSVLNGIYQKPAGAKIPYHSKPPAPYMTAPSAPHALHLQIRTNNQVKRKLPQQGLNKQPLNKPHGPPRKPVRGQAVAYSQRDEVFLPPPNTGSFSFVKSISPQIKTRETQGVGTLLGTSHFSISQPNSHFDFNRFALPDDSIFNRPVPSFIFPAKPQQQQQQQQNFQFKNTQNDDFSRNLVPPPPVRFQQQQQEKPRTKTTQKVVQENIVPVTEPLVKLEQFTTKATIRTSGFENVAVQVPSPFEQSFSFSPQKPQDQNIQVTKEKLQQFPGSVQPSFAPPANVDYVDYNFHSVPKPSNVPKPQTYEVTEGKWLDNPSPFPFNQPFLIPQKIRKLPQAPPQFIYQQERQPNQYQSGSVRPALFHSSPLVELNVPAFLPTPYRPESVVPTSPTQSEVSTVFSEVSQKMNKYKNEALTTNPFFFDVKEVSTHYPILGKPELKPQATDTPFITQENTDLSNDVSTDKDRLKEEPPTVIPSTETTTKDATKSRRRRPRPRRPSSTTTTPAPPTSTEDTPTITEVVESQRVVPPEEESVAERPSSPPTLRVRQRQRPTRYRLRGETNNRDEEQRDESSRIGDRGRQRYRHRNNNNYNNNESSSSQQNNEIRKPVKRKRIRPTSTETPADEKIMSFEELTKAEQQLEEIKEEDISAGDLNVKANIYETEPPVRHYDSAAVADAAVIESTTTTRSATEPPELSRTQRPAAADGTEPPITSPAENEVDYTTHAPPPADSDENRRYTAGAAPTTTPTTTEPTTTETATKSHRIRGRPVKYDASSRPKFSVKDYRQKLSAAQAQSTTEASRAAPESVRFRFPNRLRTRPTPAFTTTTTSTEAPQIEDTEEPHRYRSRYKYKDTRNKGGDENEEKVKSVNSKLRPFGRQRSTTETPSTTAKVSIRPYVFSAKRRPYVPSLRERINHRQRPNSTEVAETTTEAEMTTVTANNNEASTEVEPLVAIKELTTEAAVNVDLNRSDNDEDEVAGNQDEEAMKNDGLLYSQMVSDLTSSFKEEYERPGVFSSVSATSRRIPSHFTISTDEPILPIEAFFPDIKSTKKQTKGDQNEAKDKQDDEE